MIALKFTLVVIQLIALILGWTSERKVDDTQTTVAAVNLLIDCRRVYVVPFVPSTMGMWRCAVDSLVAALRFSISMSWFRDHIELVLYTSTQHLDEESAPARTLSVPDSDG